MKLSINNTIRIGIAVLFILIICFILVLAWLQLSYETRRDQLEIIHKEQELLYALNVNQARFIKEVMDFLILGEEEELEVSFYKSQTQQILSDLSEIKDIPGINPMGARFSSISNLHQDIYAVSDEIFLLQRRGDLDKALLLMEDVLEPLVDDQFKSLMDARLEDNARKIQSLNETIDYQREWVNLTIICVSTLSMLVFISFVVFSNRKISGRLARLTGELAENKTTSTYQLLQDDGGDEINDLVDTINQRAMLLEEKENALRSGQAYLQSILDNMQNLLLVCDDRGEIKSINKTAANFFGVGGKEVIGRPLLDLIDIREIDKPAQEKGYGIQKVSISRLLQSSTTLNLTGKSVLTDGSMRLLMVSTSVYLETPQAASLLICCATDITERVEAEQAAYAARDKAQKASKAKSEFLSTMSHEFRTPLNAILGFSQLLALEFKDKGDAAGLEQIQQITSAGNHLLDLINQLLDLNRIEQGTLDIRAESIELCGLLDECLQQLQFQIDNKSLQLVVDFSNSLLFVKADKVRVKQVFNNLIDNAIKYNSPGGAIIVSVYEQSKDKVKVEVRDTGLGIKACDLEKIFLPFERIVPKGKTISGTGVGLSLSKTLVEAMSGDLGVSSEAGAGSSFWFTLPIDETVTVAKAGVSKGAGQTDIKTAKRVLYIEDDFANAELMRHLFRARSEELVIAGTANSGLKMATELVPDLILLDINLPDIDGYETLKLLKSSPGTQGVPVIAVTANAMLHDVERSENEMLLAYITKPIDVNKLNTKLDAFFNLTDL